MYTHCPNCDTHFEISQEYLDIAGGKVRCGKCDHIFNALDNLYDKQEAIPDEVQTVDKNPDDSLDSSVIHKAETNQFDYSIEKSSLEKPGIEKADITPSVPSIDIKEKMERIAASLSAATAELKSARKSTTFHKSSTNYNFTDKIRISEHDESIETEELPGTDESLAPDELEIISFDNELDNLSATPKSDYSPRSVGEGDIDILNSLMDGTNQSSANNELLDELDNINKTLSDSSNSLDDEYSNLEDDFDDLDGGDDLLAELEQLESDFLNNDKISPADSSSSADGTLSADGSKEEQSITSINSSLENKEVSSQGLQEEVVPSFLTQSSTSSSSPAVMLGWLAGTIVLLLLLAAQYLHVNSTKFSQDPGIRPFLETLCPITKCPLPLIKTPRKIVTVSHDVRSHPRVNNALEIQLIFKNKASYTQGYPILEITFSNPLGEVIARRKFSPDEYLTGDIQYERGLKANQSQEINIKIVDPDPGALLSFQFNYL